jgi:histone acetyltransferase MYST1
VSAGVLQGQGIDAHPYARGQVIEVLYIEQQQQVQSQSLQQQQQQQQIHDSDDEDAVDFDLRDEEEEENEDNVVANANVKVQQETKEGSQQAQSQKPDIRLADIIDRAASKTPNHEFASHRWRYYIHYRGHNRRMDEWITDPNRILSPPSIGNAKVRAIKKQKEKEAKEKAMKEREEEEKNILAAKMKLEKGLEGSGGSSTTAGGGALAEELVRPVSQRASSRRASAAIANAVITGSSSGKASTKTSGEKTGENDEATTGDSDKTSTTATATSTVALLSPKEQEEQLRLTRRQRRKSTRSTTEDDPTVIKEKQLSAPTTVTTLLPAANNEQIKDKIVTVAAQELDEHEGLDEASLREHEEVTKVKNVAEVQLGKFRMDTWYFSPIPKELLSEGGMLPVLYVCEFTLKFFARKAELLRFQAKELPKNKRHPPGNEIYRNGNLSMFEVDGFEERMYCQNLCYIAKLFLDHKTLYFDVDPFLFYVLCEVDNRGFHPVGYYSKEKYSDVGYNLACILTFPCHQRKGYGRFLIDFSYELSKKEEKVGSPEKPMSDLGQQAYKPYWTSTIIDFLLNKSSKESSMSIMEISKSTSIMAEDIIFTLNMLGLLKYINGVYFITAERHLLEELAKKHPVKDPKVCPDRLHWTPYLTDVKRDKFSIHSKKPSIEEENSRGNGGF